MPEIGQSIGTGYASDGKGNITCYECIGTQDTTEMVTAPIGTRFTMYLTETDGQKYVQNWPGTLKRKIQYHTNGRHNIAGTRVNVWFSINGEKFFGTTYGKNTQLCHIRKIKDSK